MLLVNYRFTFDPDFFDFCMVAVNIKGSSGTIEFDHANGVLDLIVQKDSTNENSQQKDVKALSGGERSFT
jgi:chromosome segregation ATPase